MRLITRIMTVLLMFVCTVATAQTTIVKGVLQDSVTHEGEPYATVRVYKGTSTKGSADAMSVTDADGNILQKVTGRGRYTIVISSVGRKTIVRQLMLEGQKTINLGTLYVEDDTRQLQGVEVVAQKPLVKMTTDKTTYDVQSDVDSKSQTVLDMLRKVPMVTVDGQDNISVMGSSSFKVYVNGKPSIMFSSNPSQIFKSMPASSVKSIEVETNPGAKYDAEGTGGILNIIMADGGGKGGGASSLNGYNGSVRVSATNNNWNASTFVSGQQGKLTYSANVFHNNPFPMKTSVDFLRTTYGSAGASGSNGSAYNMHYYQDSKSRVPFSMMNVSLGYEIDSANQVDITVGGNHFELRNTGHPLTTLSGGVFGNGFSYTNQFDMKQRNSSIDVSADYQRFLNAKRTSNIVFTYMFNNAPSHNSTRTVYDWFSTGTTVSPTATADAQAAGYGQMPMSFNDLYSDVHSRGTEHIGQIDYVTPLGNDNHKLSAGTKFTSRANHSDSRYFNVVNGENVYNADNSSEYKNDVNILAGYAEYTGTIGKFSTRLGARYEQSWEKVKFVHGAGDDFSRHYGNFVPTGSLTWSIAPTTNLGASYAMRISRPGISYLNPYRDRSNPTSLTYGNPDLDVEKTHNINVVFNYFTPKFVINATVNQSFCDNQIYQYSFMDGDILNTTYGNIVRTRRTNLSIFANWSPTLKTRLMGNVQVGYGDMRSRQLAYHNSGWNTSAFVNLQQTLWWDVKWSLGMFARTKEINLQSLSGDMSMLFTTLSKDVIKDKLNISVMFVSPLSSRLKMNSESFNNDYYQRQNIGVDMRSIGLTVTWNFGNTKRQFQKAGANKSSEFNERQQPGQQLGTLGGGSGSNEGIGF